MKLPVGITKQKDGRFKVRVFRSKKYVVDTSISSLEDALETLREARIDVHNMDMIELDKALEAFKKGE